MKEVPVQDAVGLILCHDITEIVPGEKKGAAFRRGHVVREEDIPHLLRLGKEHLFVWDDAAGLVHEDDAARRIAAAISGPGFNATAPKEGRINLSAAHPGLFKVNLKLLDALNSMPDVSLATIHTNREVKPGSPCAGTRVIPLAVPEPLLDQVESICRADTEPVVQVLPFKPLKIGIVTTGSEVFHGRIKDGFGPVLEAKFAAWNCAILKQVLTPDDRGLTESAILELLELGADMVTVTGGMSVDPDDRSPASIRAVADEVISYGAPVLPGAMFLLAYKGNRPILGLPGCVMYHRASVFDLIMPRILAGERLTRKDITGLAHGGLCLNCPDCRFPDCSFGCC